MKLITLYIPEPYIKALDRLVDEKFYPNRAEAIRVAIRDLLSTEIWNRIENSDPKSPFQTDGEAHEPNCEM